MAILEQVIRMKGQGISDGDIINELSQQGVSPREINDALRQAQIKYAVSNTEDGEEMQPSIMPEEEIPSPEGFNNGGTYSPRVYETQQQEQYAPQETYPPQEYQPSEQYPQEKYYQPGGYEQYAPVGIDTDTIMEIADQVFSDRIKKIQKQVEGTTESSALLQTKMENVSERLKKIEAIIDKLQIVILEKVGSYGKNLEGIKKEMSMMQDSFTKMISPSRRTERKREEELSDFARERVNPVTSKGRREEEEEETNNFSEEEIPIARETKRVERTQKKISKRK